MALLTGAFIWAYEVGAKISSSIYCSIFDVDDDSMENYPHVLEAKLPVIVFLMILALIIPNNKQVYKLADYFRAKHNKALINKRKPNLSKNSKKNAGEDAEQEQLLEGGSEDFVFSFSKHSPSN
jgi:hypothetical protein